MISLKKFLILILVLLTLVVALLLIPKNRDELVPVTPTPSPIVTTPSPTQDIISPTPVVFDKEIVFNDGYLELVVRNLLKKPIGAIMQSEVNTINEINARVCAIHSIEDLVYFTSLEKLDL